MGEIILHGDCLVNRAGELHKLLLHLLSESDEQVEIDMSSTGRCDTTFFQILCSACRTYSQNKKRIVLRTPLPPSVVAQFRKAGFEEACAACDHRACLLKEALCNMDEMHSPGTSDKITTS
jgi:anti-anti-sigma regulatory factor